jgi:hypothetical protein
LTEFKSKIKIHEELKADYMKATKEKGRHPLEVGLEYTFNEQMRKILTNPSVTDNLAVVFLRNKPDILDLSAGPDFDSYFVEFKTLDNYRPPAKGYSIPNLSIELTSYASSYAMAILGIATLIVIRYPAPYNIDRGFWLEPNSIQRQRPKHVIIPSNTDEKKRKSHLEMAERTWPGIPSTISKNCVSDSGDLFILKNANDILNMSDWRDMIRTKIVAPRTL